MTCVLAFIRRWQVHLLSLWLALSALFVFAAPPPLPRKEGEEPAEAQTGSAGLLLPLLAQNDQDEATDSVRPQDLDVQSGDGLLMLLDEEPGEPLETHVETLEESAPDDDARGPVAVEPIDPEAGAPELPAEPLPEGEGEGEAALLPAQDLGLGAGTLQGEVFDKDRGVPVPNVIVSLEEFDYRTRTDGAGEFAVNGLPSKFVELKFIKSGYESAEAEIMIKQDGVTLLSQPLTERPIEVDDNEYLQEDFDVVEEFVEETGTQIEIGPAGDTSSLVQGITAEEFSTSGVDDAASAVSKIAGANIVGGRYAVIRGLGDRYANTLVNGALISSADPSRKAVQLDLFPSHLLQSVNIIKTFSPNLPAEWAGGIVLLETLRYPEERVLDVKIGTGYNAQLAEADEFFTVPGVDLGILGEYDGPTITNDFGTTFDESTAGPEFKQLQESLHSLRPFRPDTSGLRPGTSLEVTYADNFDLGRGSSLGLTLALTHATDDAVKLGIQKGRELDVNDGIVGLQQTVDEYERTVRWGALGSLNYRFNDHHEMGYTLIRNRVSTHAVNRMRFGVSRREGSMFEVRDGVLQPIFISSQPLFPDPPPPSITTPFYGAAAIPYQAFDALEIVQRDLTAHQAYGSHKFGEDPERGPKFRWAFSNSESEELRPLSSNLKMYQLDFADPAIANRTYPATKIVEPFPGIRVRVPDPDSPPIPETYEPERGTEFTFADLGREGTAGIIRHLTQGTLSTAETNRYGGMDVSVPVYFNDESDDRFEIALGGALQRKDREVRGEIFGLRADNEAVNLPVFIRQANGQIGIDYAEEPNALFFPAPNGAAIFDQNPTSNSNLTYRRMTIDRDERRNVDAFTNIDALYMMGSLFVDNWHVMGGVRYENELRAYEILRGLNFVGPNELRSDSQENEYFFPAISVNKTFGYEDEHEVGIAWSRTIARPTFYEFAPIFTVDQGTGEIIAGNAALTDSIIDNFDVRWSWAPPRSPGTSIGVNVFRKSIEDPITKAFNLSKGDIGADILTFRNGARGTLQGVEFELQHDLSPSFNLTANYTYIDASLITELLNRDLQLEEVNVAYEGQPEHIFNLNLGYSNEDWRFTANLVYNFTGEFLFIVPRTVIDEQVIQEGRHTMDLILRKDIDAFGGEGTISFKVGNLLDSPISLIFDPSGSIYEEYDPGRSFSLSYTQAF